MQLPPENLDGYTFYILGEPTTITLFDGKKVGYDAENHRVYLPSDKPRERLIQWLKNNARRILTTVTERQAARMGVSYASVTVTSTTGRWGSCSSEGKIRYTFRLLYCPREIIEYVVVHELAHIRHLDHSKAFWQEVEGYVPEWKACRRWLQEYAILMEIF